ncbi:replication-relaxation family protein [Paenibacillus anseongense]|uniref:replication-relaxation family protein n=1 Tax=Paenibacillus anseongense TaxID=2682845 RepID=UPI002DC05AA7|nr:replication-relaxation family protein [Paenibacillus anseongense]MEC0266715.1 replication-relaxation family protein [Paenibacillus anseongense]
MNLVQAKILRWTEILTSIDNLGFLTTSQIQRLHDLGGRRNTTRILNDMSEFLCSFREHETVYYLSAKGRKELGSQKLRRRTIHTQHTLMRNDVYIAYKPDYWRVETPLKWADKSIIPDAVFKNNNSYVFLEVDHTQSIAANERKIELYKELRDSGGFQRKYGAFPMIMYVTVNEHRQKRLRGLLDGFKAEVLLVNDIK